LSGSSSIKLQQNINEIPSAYSKLRRTSDDVQTRDRVTEGELVFGGG